MVGVQARTLTHSFTRMTPRRAWSGYCSALESQPLAVKAATAALGFTLGDCIAQLATRPPKGVAWRFDTFRTLRLAAYGGCIGGPMGHHWFGFLDRVVMPHKPRSAAAIVTKIGLDQAIMAPIGTILFFSIAKLLDGFQTDAVIPTVQEKLVPTVCASYKLWPLAHTINFAFVPPSQRILYINIIAIAWTFILSQSAASKGDKPEMVAASIPSQVSHLETPSGQSLVSSPVAAPPNSSPPTPFSPLLGKVVNCLPPDEDPATASLELLEEMHGQLKVA